MLITLEGVVRLAVHIYKGVLDDDLLGKPDAVSHGTTLFKTDPEAFEIALAPHDPPHAKDI